jgi:hypothetical protein
VAAPGPRCSTCTYPRLVRGNDWVRQTKVVPIAVIDSRRCLGAAHKGRANKPVA